MATNFERVTASPEALGALLKEICAAAGPWDWAFQNRYCASCSLEDCPDPCPHEEHRSNPTWWLRLSE